MTLHNGIGMAHEGTVIEGIVMGVGRERAEIMRHNLDSRLPQEIEEATCRMRRHLQPTENGG